MTAEFGAPFVVENPSGTGAAVILVDHASNAIPARWAGLGIDETARHDHIAWDPGALPVAREMARLLDAPLVAGTVSRLVLDLNRPVGSRTMMPAVSETTRIPGNEAISEEDRAFRIATIWEPYHRAVDTVVARQAERAGPDVAVIAIHTFTPVYKGQRRALHVGILFDRDERLARTMLDRLAGEAGLDARANEPYSPADEVYYTLDRHAAGRGLRSVMIEIRNDLVREAADQLRWAERLTAASGLCAGGGAGRDRTAQSA